jgi:hypothetical protein
LTLACTFDAGGCPAGTRPNPNNDTCDPCPADQTLDSFTLTCSPTIPNPG